MTEFERLYGDPANPQGPDRAPPEIMAAMVAEMRAAIEGMRFNHEIPVVVSVRATWEGGLWVRRRREGDPWVGAVGVIDVWEFRRTLRRHPAAGRSAHTGRLWPRWAGRLGRAGRTGRANDYRREVAPRGEVNGASFSATAAPSAERSGFALPIPLGDRRSSIWGDPAARIYPEMLVDGPETASEPLAHDRAPMVATNGSLSLRDVVHACTTSTRRFGGSDGCPDDFASRDVNEASGTFGKEAPRARESRHSTLFFLLSRYGPAGSSTVARVADRAVLVRLT